MHSQVSQMDGTVTSVGSPALAPTAGATPAAAPADAARHVGTAIGCTCIGVPLSREGSSTGSISLPDPEPLRRCRSTSRDDVSAASSPRDRPSPLSKAPMHKGESSKAGLKIIKATGDELELQASPSVSATQPLPPGIGPRGRAPRPLKGRSSHHLAMVRCRCRTITR